MGSIELINAARTTAYLQNLMPAFPLVRRTSIYDSLPAALGDEPYRSPFLDQADWVETRGEVGPAIRNPTHEFYGLYPLSIEGVGDSTMGAAVVEGILEGGAINSERDATRPIRVHGLLIGANQLAAEAGLTWLRNALRSNTCGMHGDLCGYHDLRYFLAPPQVCDPLWTTGYDSTASIPMGGIDMETSPLVYAHGVPGQPHRYEWEFLSPSLDGVKITWGALELDGAEVLEQHGPTYLRRSNFILNPSFTVGTASWSVTDGTVTRLEAGGLQFGRFDSDDPVTYRSNWLPDPSFENGDPNGRGWRGSGDITDAVDGTAPQGTHVAVVPAGGAWIETSMLGPYDSGVEGTLSFWKRHDDDLVVTVTDNIGTLVFTQTLTGLADSWERVEVNDLPVFRDYVVRIASAGSNELRVDGFLLEATGSMGDYFDGNTTDDPGSDTDYYFVPNPSGPSREAVGVYSSFIVESAQTDAPFGPAVLTFRMRSVEARPAVLVEIVDPDDTVISSVTLNPSSNWNRYALGASFGRKVRARFTSSTGYFDLDEVMLEAGSEVNAYFDGDSIAPADYSLSWQGTANNSISRMSWQGSTLIERSDNWRPFLSLSQGDLDSVSLSAAWADEIEMTTQLEPYDRTYHKVSCTTGVKRIRDVVTNAGVAIEVDFILTAATPHAFSTQEIAIPFDPEILPTPLSDETVNLLTNPNPRTGHLTGWSAFGTGASSVAGEATDIYTTTTTTGLAAGSFGLKTTLTVGTDVGDLLPNAIYSFAMQAGSGVTPSTPKRVQLHVSGSGVSREGLTSYLPPIYGLTSLVVDFETGDSGSVDIQVDNGEATVTGTNIIVASRGLVMFGNAYQSAVYFDGSTTDTDAYDYSWDGTADASTSRRVIHIDTQDPLIDPDLPAVPTPPAPPTIPDNAIEDQNEWLRYNIVIPAGDVALWAGTVPTLAISTKTEDVRQVRVRFQPNPFGWDPGDISPIDYCGEFILSYLPANSILTVSGVSREAWAQVAGGAPQSANQLLYGTGGTPMDWPELSCALEYVMTIDVPPGLAIDDLDFDLTINRRE
jgi:hypothetical protein